MYEFKTTPYKHQIDALRSGRVADGRIKSSFAYLMEMGTGKTKVIIDEICAAYEAGIVDTAIILAPKGVYLNWIRREIPIHMPDRIQERADIVEWRAGGGGVAHSKVLEKLLEPSEKLRVLVMNIESFSSGDRAWKYVLRFLASSQKIYGACDESTFIKNPSATRSERAVIIGSKCLVRRIATGSPVTRSPLDLYSQFEFLGPRMLGFSSFYSFRARYAVMKQQIFGGRKVQVVVGYQQMEDLSRRIAPHSFRVKKEDCLDLPPKVYVQREVEMTDEQSRIYASIRLNATARITETEHVTATEVITQILRLHQVVCGHVTDEAGVIHDISNNRVEVLLEVLAETSGKAIIWSRYRHDISKIVAALSKEYGPYAVVQYHGGTSVPEREAATESFQNGEARFIVSNAQTGGFGNTWTAASTVIYYSNDYDLEKRMQSEDRAHRSGQTKSVTYVDLVCPNTVDEKILKALRMKINLASAIMGDGYREWLI